MRVAALASDCYPGALNQLSSLVSKYLYRR
jgi:hypothetical protein